MYYRGEVFCKRFFYWWWRFGFFKDFVFIFFVFFIFISVCVVLDVYCCWVMLVCLLFVVVGVCDIVWVGKMLLVCVCLGLFGLYLKLFLNLFILYMLWCLIFGSIGFLVFWCWVFGGCFLVILIVLFELG